MRVLVIMFIFSVAPSYTQTDLPGPVRALSNFVTPQPIASWNVAQTFYSGFVDAGSTGHNNVWKLPLNSVSGCLQDNGSYTLNITACPPGSPAGADMDVQVNSGGFFYADANFQYNHVSPQVVTVTGVSGNPSIVAVTSFIQSDQGFLSKANNWQAFNTLTDGALLRGYHLDHPDASTGAPQYTGGYLDIAMIAYIPTGGAAYPPHDPRNCYDQFANLASNPIPLNGLSAFGTGDVLLWNSPSPLQGYLGGSPYHINGTPCGSPIPMPVYDGISNNTGLNTNAYVLAMGGFATPINSANAVQIWTGGVTALEYFAAGFYPAGTVTSTGTLTSATYLGGFMYMGHSNQVPGNGASFCRSIASCTNPLLPGLGFLQGMFYFDDNLATMNLSLDSTGTNWKPVALQNTSTSFTEITTTNTTGSCINYQIASFEFQVDCNGNVSTTGASSGHGVITVNGAFGGLNVSASASPNAIQAPSGGMYAGLGMTTNEALYPKGLATCGTQNNPGSGYGGFGYNTGSTYCYWNGTTWASINLSTIGGGGYWNLSGSALYNNAGSYVTVGATVDDGSHAALQSASALSVTGTIQSINTGLAIAFKTQNNNFSVDGNGDISGAGILHMTGTTGLNYMSATDLVVGNASVLDYTGSAGRNLQVVSSLTNNWAALRLTSNVLTGSNAGTYIEYASTDTGISAGDHRLGEDQWFRNNDVTGGQVTASYSKFLTYNGTIYQRESISGNTHNVLGPGSIANEVFSVLDNSGTGNGYIQLGRNGTTLAQLAGIAGGDFAIDAIGAANNVFYLYNSGAQAFTLSLYQGNVGVKYATPNWPLDVHGGNSSQIHINGNNSGAGGYLFASNGDNNINMSAGMWYNGTNWITTASSYGLIGVSGFGVTLFNNPSVGVGAAVTPNQIAGFTSTANSLFAKTAIGNSSVVSQLNINSGTPSSDFGGFFTSTLDNGLFLSGGMEYTTNSSVPWVARSNSGATAITLIGGSGISILINNTTSSGFNFTPTLTASFRANSFNFTGHINGSLGIVSPTVSGSGGAVCALGSGSTDTRGSIVWNAPGVCNLNFASAYSTAPVCVGQSSNVNSSTTFLYFTPTTTQWSISTNNTNTVYYYCIQ